MSSNESNFPQKQQATSVDVSVPVRSVGTLKSLLATDAMQKTMKTVLPRHLTPDRMVKMALIAANRSPKLLECTGTSILESIMRAGEFGLDCSGTMGDGYLVPFKNTCQFIPGYRGLVRLAIRSGEIASIYSEVVFKQDKFEVKYGIDRDIVHVPDLNAKPTDADAVAVYAVAKFKDASISPQFVVMTRAEIDKVRRASRSGNAGPWVDWWVEMAKKTAIRRLCKNLPLSPDQPLAAALAHEDAVNGYDAPQNQTMVASDASPAGIKNKLIAATATPADVPGSSDRRVEPVDTVTGEVYDQTVPGDAADGSSSNGAIDPDGSFFGNDEPRGRVGLPDAGEL